MLDPTATAVGWLATDATARPCAWARRIFAGSAELVSAERVFVRDLLVLCGYPQEIVEDAEIVADELVVNAITHTASGRPNGRVRVEYLLYEGGLRIGVWDGGGPTQPRVCVRHDDPLADGGRGLWLANQLATRRGVVGDERGRLVWCDIGKPLDSEPQFRGFAPREEMMRYEEEARAAHADLASRIRALRQQVTDASPWDTALAGLVSVAQHPEPDRAWWPRARGDAATLASAVAAITATHHPVASDSLTADVPENVRHLYVTCAECRVTWPCPTVEHVRTNVASHEACHLAGIACPYC